MEDETVRDIHTRLGRIEDKLDTVLANKEALRWIKRHIWALWAAILALVGIKVM